MLVRRIGRTKLRISFVITVSRFIDLRDHLLGFLFLHTERSCTVGKTVLIRCVDKHMKCIRLIAQDIIGTASYDNTGFLRRKCRDDATLCLKDPCLTVCRFCSERKQHFKKSGGILFLLITNDGNRQIQLLRCRLDNISIIILHMKQL